MLARIKKGSSYLFSWLGTSFLLTLALFQLHATLIVISLAIVDTPSLRPAGWNTGTLYGLSRAFWLILGSFWLAWVTFTEDYLREEHLLKRRTIRLLIIIGTIYLGSYLILLLFR